MYRRLSAILAADVVGYSAMMAKDESGTLARLIRFRKTVFDPAVGTHEGRVVKLMGDGALVEFSSVVSAVECAVELQETVNREKDGIRLRVGVNLGDVIARDGDIYGDGVNIAARLEALAEPGGICLSASVFNSVGKRIDASFSDAGDHQLKNIETPVRIYRWVPAGGLDAVLANQPQIKREKPGIAVLAFDNMSADPEQEYFSDGIAEDIITELSHFREFFVIARNTTFSYKGQPINVGQVCRDLGVRYLLEGSVRKAGNRVRVNAQLIDGENDAHIWANRYDRELDDIFAVQDEITRAIVGAVAPQTLGAELKRVQSKASESLDAWDKVLQARWHLGRLTKTDNMAARSLLNEAIATDPDLSDAYATLALCILWDMLHLWQPNPDELISDAAAMAHRAIALDATNANAHAMMGMADSFARNFEDAEKHLDTAIRLNPNLAAAYGNRAPLYGVSRDYENAKKFAARALELSPRDSSRCFWLGGVGIGAYITGAYEDCVAISRQVLKDFPGYASAMRQETASLAMLERTEEAKASLERLLERIPGLTIEQVRKMVPVRYAEDHEHWLEGLRRAGLPE